MEGEFDYEELERMCARERENENVYNVDDDGNDGANDEDIPAQSSLDLSNLSLKMLMTLWMKMMMTYVEWLSFCSIIKWFVVILIWTNCLLFS